MARSPRRTARALDWPPQCAIVAAVALLTEALNEAGRRGRLDPAVLAGVGLAVVAAAAFAVRERPAWSPALPLRLLRSRAMGGGAVIGLLFKFGFYGLLFTASLEFQHQRGFSALGNGLALFPSVAMTMFASALSGRLAAVRVIVRWWSPACSWLPWGWPAGPRREPTPPTRYWCPRAAPGPRGVSRGEDGTEGANSVKFVGPGAGVGGVRGRPVLGG
ncbi:hypothetical protein ACFV2X_06330 [Streptomyces sp. NPDC059679]|uniref:hypothetical protein n=1 Tax=Streptomyces sp. NPDC059679 TaxID=3346903 RepID=UPI0036CE1798